MNPVKRSKREQAIQDKLEAAFVEASPSLCRKDQEHIRDELFQTCVKVSYGLSAPPESVLAWGFRGIKEKDGTFSLLQDRQGIRAFGSPADAIRFAFSDIIKKEVLPVLQRNSEMMGHARETVYYHFKWSSSLGIIRAVTTTYGDSGYVYGIVYLEPT